MKVQDLINELKVLNPNLEVSLQIHLDSVSFRTEKLTAVECHKSFTTHTYTVYLQGEY